MTDGVSVVREDRGAIEVLVQLVAGGTRHARPSQGEGTGGAGLITSVPFSPLFSVPFSPFSVKPLS